MKTLLFKTHNNSKIQSKLLSKFERENDVEIEFDSEPCDHAPDFDESIMKSFQRTLNNDSELQYCGVSHNWFDARVSVKYRGYESTQYLGGCSYASYEEFKNDAYYYQMISEAIDEINRNIKDDNINILSRWKVRNLKRAAFELGFALIPKSAIVCQ